MIKNKWQPAHLAPYDVWVLLYLKAPDGEEKPIGQLVGKFIITEVFEGFVEKTATGNLNTGLQQNLVTHFKLLDEDPDGTTNTAQPVKVPARPGGQDRKKRS